jgi:N utilization substance protein A
MKSDFLIAVTQLAAERGLPKESVVSAVEAALASAYKKDSTAAGHDITVKLDPANGEVQIFTQRTVVVEVEEPQREVSLADAQKEKPDAVLGDVLETEAFFPAAGRIAAQTAKQVVLQRLREAERELVLAEYTNRVGDLIAGRIERVEPHQVVVNLGRVEAIMPKEEQVPIERYRPNQTLQFYLLEVASTARGPEIILSRSHRELLRRLFEREVPEIFNGIVEIQAIAREPGSRSKVAVSTRQPRVDPVGSCVGLRGFRIQNIVNELQGENIDVIQWDTNQAAFLSSALNPAQVLKVELDEVNKAARMVVNDRQLSLAIGREGQNVRLAAKLTGWKIDLMGLTEFEGGVEPSAEEKATATAVAVAEREAQESVAEVAVEPAQETPAAKAAKAPAEVVAETPAEEQPQEAVPVAAEVGAPTAPKAPALSAEEELLAASEPDEKEPPKQTPPPKKTPDLPTDTARFWGLPAKREPSVLRFAEDIMPGRGRGRNEETDQALGRRGKTRQNRQSTGVGATEPETETTDSAEQQ